MCTTGKHRVAQLQTAVIEAAEAIEDEEDGVLLMGTIKIHHGGSTDGLPGGGGGTRPASLRIQAMSVEATNAAARAASANFAEIEAAALAAAASEAMLHAYVPKPCSSCSKLVDSRINRRASTVHFL